MTINIGWIWGNSCFLVVDSLITAGSPDSVQPALLVDDGRPAEMQRSSFGEVLAKRDNGHMFEAGAKIVHITDTIAAAYSGDTKNAMDAFAGLRNEIRRGTCLPDAIANVQNRLSDVLAMVAHVDSAIGPRIWCASRTRIVEHYRNGLPVVSGSGGMNTVERNFAFNTVRSILTLAPPDPDDVLAGVVCGCQAHGQRTDTIRLNFGGAYFGIRVDAAGLHPCKDTLFATYDRRRSPLPSGPGEIDGGHAILTCARENALIVHNFTMRGGSAFLTDVRPVLDSEIMREMTAITESPPQPAYIAFVEKETGSILVVARDVDDETAISVRYSDAGVSFTMIPQLRSELESYSALPDQPAIVPFKFFKSTPGKRS